MNQQLKNILHLFRKRWLAKPKKKINLDFTGNSTLLLINILFNSRRNEHKFVNIYLSIFQTILGGESLCSCATRSGKRKIFCNILFAQKNVYKTWAQLQNQVSEIWKYLNDNRNNSQSDVSKSEKLQTILVTTFIIFLSYSSN